MAVRFNGTSASGFSTTSGVPTTASFTITCWFYLVSAAPSGLLMWSLDSSATQYAYLGVEVDPSSALLFDWQGTGATIISAAAPLSVGTWYKTGVVVSGTTARLYQATASSALSTYSETANFVLPSGTLKLWIGDSVHASFYGHYRLAAFKMWNSNLTKAEVEQELCCYVPRRTANLTHWYPMVRKETTDYSGHARTLTGGSAATTEPGPPIAWTRLRAAVLPWDPSTDVWYAHYNSTTGELLSLGTIEPDLVATPGTAFLEILGQPNQAEFEWSTTARAFVRREGVDLMDRVADLLADSTLTAAWASLTGPESAAMQARIAQMLGPYRYRQSFQDVDLT